MLAVARMAAHIVGGERIGLAPAPARRLAGEALQNAADAIMAGRIVGAGVNVAGADRGADRAHGGRGGAIGNPLGKVGGDGERIGWQRLVAGECGPFRPPAPCRSGTAPACCRRGYRGVPHRRAPGRLRSIRPAG